KRPEIVPTYAQSYRAFRDMFNYDARQVALMAWNGANGLYMGQPGYVTYTSWRNTPAEEALRDHMVSHAGIPLKSRLWTFGTAQHRDDDGWSAHRGTLAAGFGNLKVEGEGREIVLHSPADQVIRHRNASALIVGAQDAAAIASIEIWGRADPRAHWKKM